MKIVADENIPHIKHYFSACGELVLKSGRAIKQHDLVDADILLVRSVTQVNEELLENTSIKFVGSTTTGFDHLNIPYLEKNDIQWATAAGCNAMGVAEYVVCVVAALQMRGLLKSKKLRAGVIGVGHIGQLVADKLKILGFDVVYCDPLRALQDAAFVSMPLNELYDLDFITLHTPLTHDGPYPTHHLIEKQFLQRQKQGCVILNAGRGAAVNFADVKKYGQHLQWCLDVWEHEPVIDRDVLALACIATPHIAGYSIQSKYRSIEMIYREALLRGVILDHSIPAVPLPVKKISLDGMRNWQDVVLQVYNPVETSLQMKEILLRDAGAFDQMRKSFADRYEFGSVQLLNGRLGEEEKVRLLELGFLV